MLPWEASYTEGKESTLTVYKTPGGDIYSIFDSLLKQSHVLIAGSSGSGKSVLVNGIVATAITAYSPASVQFVLIDPKRVELSPYKSIPHTIRYASEPDDMLQALEDVATMIDRRYTDMQARGQRKHTGSDVYVIIDELADLMTTQKKLVLPSLQRISQVGRAAKVHIIACTQSPLACVIPTTLKVNFDCIVGLRVRSKQDSRNILGVTGLETLPRYGSCIMSSCEGMQRYKVPYITEDEQNKLIQYWTDRDRCMVRI